MKTETYWVIEFGGKYYHLSAEGVTWQSNAMDADRFSSKEYAKESAEFYQATVREVTYTIK